MHLEESHKSLHVSYIESLSETRLMFQLSGHPYWGNDAIFCAWPEDGLKNRIKLGVDYIDESSVFCKWVVTAVGFEPRDGHNDIRVWVKDADDHLTLLTSENMIMVSGT